MCTAVRLGLVSARPTVIAVVGPTAVGKSELAIALARRLGGEVVNADAMQCYAGMDIGTAKVPRSQRAGVPHHLLDVLDISESASVAGFQQAARAVLEDCRARAVPPVLVGGSALYVRAVLDDFAFPGTDPQLREQVERDADAYGVAALHERLRVLDPQAADDILPSNRRRIVRALEVIALTGAPFKARLPPHVYVIPALQVGLDAERAELDARIERRVHRMWEAGLLDEVRELEARGLRHAPTASRALGYPQALAHLDGELTRAEAIEQTVRATSRFARRQDSWFRKDPRIRWVPANAPDREEQALTYYRQLW